MKRITRGLLTFGVLAVFLSTLAGCQGMFGPIKPKAKTMLWNGKDFAGWELFIPDKSVDVHDIWSIRDGIVHCKGVPNGYMRTNAEYANYRLHLEWRWPEKPTNSGVLLHACGPDKVWPLTIECQLKAGNAGDFVLIGGPGITVDGKDMQDTEKQFVVATKKAPSSEKPAGQWNAYDIHCDGDVIRCYVNDVLQNEGTAATITSGWICLQSEGSPIEFRNIYIEPANPKH
ncbi:MAG: hypothetical protein CEE38_04710 [Planctomycetes bacterium B3_Pla]|nr:MAG: hypothetical protein CEE38_04710 [Planctomycetes bacterium B3_Pla]